jgi:hypothetical protein
VPSVIKRFASEMYFSDSKTVNTPYIFKYISPVASQNKTINGLAYFDRIEAGSLDIIYLFI